MEIQRENEHVVVLKNNFDAQNWLLVRQVLDAKVEREGVAATEISLAFPLLNLRVTS